MSGPVAVAFASFVPGDSRSALGGRLDEGKSPSAFEKLARDESNLANVSISDMNSPLEFEFHMSSPASCRGPISHPRDRPIVLGTDRQSMRTKGFVVFSSSKSVIAQTSASARSGLRPRIVPSAPNEHI